MPEVRSRTEILFPSWPRVRFRFTESFEIVKMRAGPDWSILAGVIHAERVSALDFLRAAVSWRGGCLLRRRVAFLRARPLGEKVALPLFSNSFGWVPK